MELRYGPTSPFARKCRVVAIETGQRDKLKLVLTKAMDSNTDLGTINPLVKVPALVMDNGQPLYDSPVICEYLDSLHSGTRMIPAETPERWYALRRQALGDGLADAFVAWRAETRRDAAEGAARQKQKVENAFDALAAELGALTKRPVGIDSIAVACGIGYLDLNAPDWGWRDKRPQFAAWYKAFCDRPSMRETAAAKAT